MKAAVVTYPSGDFAKPFPLVTGGMSDTDSVKATKILEDYSKSLLAQ